MDIHSLPVTSPTPHVLTMPGLDGSGPGHWQSLWEEQLPNCTRVEVPDWSRPIRDQWIERLGHAVARSPGRIVLVAHSLGCLTVAWWAKLRWSADHHDKIIAALLVAPPSVGVECRSDRLHGFRPTPRTALPFPSMLVASRTDPYCSLETSQHLAEAWGSGLVDAGPLGHINAESGIGEWDDGLALLEKLIVTDAQRNIRSALAPQIAARGTGRGRSCAQPNIRHANRSDPELRSGVLPYTISRQSCRVASGP